MKPSLIISHLATLVVGVGAAYFLFSNQQASNHTPGSNENGVATTFAGNTGGGSSGNASDLNLNSLSSVRLEQSGYKMGSEDPLAAIAAAKTIPGRNNRSLYTDSVFTAWGEKNGPEAVAWILANLKGVEKSDALYNVADGWAETDPAGAAAWFNENTSGSSREDAIYEILESWGRKAPEEALAWTENLDDYTRSTVMDSLAEGWAAKDPVAAARASEKLLEYDFGDEFVMSVASQWASSDPNKAAAWVGTINDEDARAIGHLEVGNQWAMSDPEKAVAWFNSLSSEEDKTYAAIGVAQGWAEHDPGASLKWAIAAVESAEERQRIIEDVMLDWSSSDPAEAAEWLKAQPKGPQNDEVLATFSSSIVDIDPESAVIWAATITNPELREESLDDLLDEWISMDESAARQWISKSELSDTLKQKYGSGN